MLPFCLHNYSCLCLWGAHCSHCACATVCKQPVFRRLSLGPHHTDNSAIGARVQRKPMWLFYLYVPLLVLCWSMTAHKKETLLSSHKSFSLKVFIFFQIYKNVMFCSYVTVLIYQIQYWLSIHHLRTLQCLLRSGKDHLSWNKKSKRCCSRCPSHSQISQVAAQHANRYLASLTLGIRENVTVRTLGTVMFSACTAPDVRLLLPLWK